MKAAKPAKRAPYPDSPEALGIASTRREKVVAKWTAEDLERWAEDAQRCHDTMFGAGDEVREQQRNLAAALRAHARAIRECDKIKRTMAGSGQADAATVIHETLVGAPDGD